MTESKSNPQEELLKLRRSPAMAAWQNTLKDLNNGNHAAALASYRNLVKEFPNVPQLWTEMGIAAAGELEFTLADQAFQRALELSPREATLFVFIASQYYHLRRMDRALDCLNRAVAIDPAAVGPRLTLVAWLERSRQLDQAWECLETCLSQHPEVPQSLYLKAFLLQRKGLNSEAEITLRNLLEREATLPVDVQCDANHLLGIVFDAQGRYGEALLALGKSKTLRCRTINTASFEKIFNEVEAKRRELLAELTPDTIRLWRDQAADSPCGRPLAFLGGAMRSGTTLIEQVLGAHPDILVFDEVHSFLKEVLTPLRPPPPERWLTVKFLNGLPASLRTRMISRYFKNLLRDQPENQGTKLVLDKNPSTTAWLHVWLRFFPMARVLIALRDPRDVVISCFFQNTPAPWAIVSFLNLERTAKFYADCMDVWLRMRDLGGFEWMETRYEDIVGNLEGEGQRITNFLGLPWHQDQATYHETARRKFVNSPTYNDVTKPVHSRSVERWRHYAEALEPAQAILSKYCQAFRYA